jgi:hypothetical protein
MSRDRRHTELKALCICCALIFVPPALSAPPASIEDRPIVYDADGLIVQKSSDGIIDGGDTAQREGWYWLGVWIRAHTQSLQPWTPKRKLNFDQVLRLLEPKSDGIFYRHPKEPKYNNPFDKEYGFSRDQMIPLIAAMGVWGKRDGIGRMWNALPEDNFGKHAFNGNWRNYLGQDGADCGDILKRGCDANADCSLQTDNRDCSLHQSTRACNLEVDRRDCSLQTDNRDCSLNVDRTDCSLQVDTRSCGHDVLGVHINDPFCEAAKAAQNAGYSAAKGVCETTKAAKNADFSREKAMCEAAKTAQDAAYSAGKASCESAKTAQNGAYAAAKATCEAQKGTENALYASQKASCEVSKAAQNAVFAAEKGICEVGKTSGKYACEVAKQAAFQTCRMSNVFSGDLIGPDVVNLFRRALGSDPLAANPDTTTQTLVQGGPSGEMELLIDTEVRLAKAQKDRDDVGDDLNLIVMLLTAKLNFPSPLTESTLHTYATNRQLSYGSYLGAYYQHYGSDTSNFESRVMAGVASGWRPDVSGPHGAVRWYHRPNVGGNPQLATLYEPIIDLYFK